MGWRSSGMEKVRLYLCGSRVVSMRTEESIGFKRPHSEAQARAVLTLSSRGSIRMTQDSKSTACTVQSNVASSSKVMRTRTCFFQRSSCGNDPRYRRRMVGAPCVGGLEITAPVSISERSSTETMRRSALIASADSASFFVIVFVRTSIRRFAHEHIFNLQKNGLRGLYIMHCVT